MTETDVSWGMTQIMAELGSVNVSAPNDNVKNAAAFAAKFIDERSKTPTGWRDELRSLAVRVIAMRVAMVNGNIARRNEHHERSNTHRDWLLKRGVSEDELKELTFGIRDRMIE